jgi:hypothetical protein
MMESELDYDFEVAGEKYFAVHEKDYVNIMDLEGEYVVHVFNYANLYEDDKAFPLTMAQMLIVGYQQGVKDGINQGVSRAQYMMRAALGL